MTDAPLRIGIAGLGTVGASVIKILQAQESLLQQRCQRPLEIVAVSARQKNRNRGVSLSCFDWAEDPLSLAERDDVDVIVELIGGSEGVAYELCTKALAAGKSVVTANKALLAEHGAALADLAGKHKATLAYEAAVAGGIPAIKALREGLSGNQVESIYGILNCTCNYILTSMAKTKACFMDVLTEAQHLGYAEADPSFDIDGVDTAHKLAILASLAFGTAPDFKNITVEGIRSISAQDVENAATLGFTIKLLGIARQGPEGIVQQVRPCLIPQSAVLAPVDDVYNAVILKGDYVGSVMLQGKGAGGAPTASAVVADLVDIANGRHTPVLGHWGSADSSIPTLPVEHLESSFYVRFTVKEAPGVVAQIATALANQGVSIMALHQQETHHPDAVPLMLTTHACHEAALQKALASLEDSGLYKEPPVILKIEYL